MNTLDAEPSPWLDLFPEIRGEVVKYLDPYAKQTLALTCKDEYNRWNNPHFGSKAGKYYVLYAPMEHIAKYICVKSNDRRMERILKIILYAPRSRRLTTTFFEELHGAWNMCLMMRNSSDRACYEHARPFIKNLVTGILRYGNVELYKFLNEQRWKWGWLQEEISHLFHRLTQFQCVLSHGNVDLSLHLASQDMGPLKFGIFWRYFLLSDRKHWTDSIVVARLLESLGEKPVGDHIHEGLTVFSTITKPRSPVRDGEAVLKHLFDVWDFLQPEQQARIQNIPNLIKRLIQRAPDDAIPRIFKYLDLMKWTPSDHIF